MMTQKFRIQPPTGYPVQYFAGDDTTSPCPAVIQKIEGSGSGLAVLTIFPPATTQSNALRKFVYHVDCPERPEKPNWLAEYGTWDYIPGMKRVGEIPQAEWDQQLAKAKADAAAAAAKPAKTTSTK